MEVSNFKKEKALYKSVLLRVHEMGQNASNREAQLCSGSEQAERLRQNDDMGTASLERAEKRCNAGVE